MTQEAKIQKREESEKNLDNTKVTSNKYLPYQSEQCDSENSSLSSINIFKEH